MSSTPDPARLSLYQERLGRLIAGRDAARAEHEDQRVKVFNRQIRAQIRWIRKAQSAAL